MHQARRAREHEREASALLGPGDTPPPLLPPRVELTPPVDAPAPLLQFEVKVPDPLPVVPAGLPRNDIAAISEMLRSQPNMTVAQIGRLLDMFEQSHNAPADANALPPAPPPRSQVAPQPPPPMIIPPPPVINPQELAPHLRASRSQPSRLSSLLPPTRKRYWSLIIVPVVMLLLPLYLLHTQNLAIRTFSQ